MAGKVVSVEGRVLIRKDSGADGSAAAAGRPLKPGDQVVEGDVINTASDGKVKLLLQDMTILDLSTSALFKVQKFAANHGGDRQVDLQMPYGTARVSVSKAIASGGKFQIRTKTATMGVRGTEFIVQTGLDSSVGKKSATGAQSAPSAPSATKITVVQGKVEVATPPVAASLNARGLAAVIPKAPPVMLTAGTQLLAKENAPSLKPVTLSAADISAVTASTKVVDNTFSKAVNLNLGGENGQQQGQGGSQADSSAGQATRAAISQAVSISTAAQPPTQTVSFVPQFAPASIAPNMPVVAGGFSHIRVVVK